MFSHWAGSAYLPGGPFRNVHRMPHIRGAHLHFVLCRGRAGDVWMRVLCTLFPKITGKMLDCERLGKNHFSGLSWPLSDLLPDALLDRRNAAPRLYLCPKYDALNFLATMGCITRQLPRAFVVTLESLGFGKLLGVIIPWRPSLDGTDSPQLRITLRA